MGIFSLFGKKGAKQGDSSAEKSSGKKKSRSQKSGNSDVTGFEDSQVFSPSIIAQRHIARATERKIDAIEFEMTREIVKPRPVTGNTTTNPPSKLDIPSEFPKAEKKNDVVVEFQTTLPMMVPTDCLLGTPSEMSASALAESEAVPVLEEAAILFANGQIQVAEHMLHAAVHNQDLGSATEIGWQMLFDLYRISNDQHKFESLSLDYANKFETSPPFWPEKTTQVEDKGLSNNTALVSFPVKLDASVVKVLERVQSLSAQSKSLKLDFSRIKEVDPVGCGLLLRALKALKKSGHDLMLVSAQDLADKIKSIIQVGRRDETEAPWLLLLEILQLLQFEQMFEDISMDYCITFEVSPPSFEAPKINVVSAFPEAVLAEIASDRFMMPAVIEGRTDYLISSINEQAESHNPLILDCSELDKVEFSASAQLLSGLAPIAAKPGMSIRFEQVNYLVLMLFSAMGLKNIASISARKH